MCFIQKDKNKKKIWGEEKPRKKMNGNSFVNKKKFMMLRTELITNFNRLFDVNGAVSILHKNA